MIQPRSGPHVANDPRIARSPDVISGSVALYSTARRVDHEPVELASPIRCPRRIAGWPRSIGEGRCQLSAVRSGVWTL